MDLQQMLSLSYMHIGDISFMFLTEFFTGAKSEAGWLFRPGRKTGTWTSPRHALRLAAGWATEGSRGTQHFSSFRVGWQRFSHSDLGSILRRF
jgi:hypothetical protein